MPGSCCLVGLKVSLLHTISDDSDITMDLGWRKGRRKDKQKLRSRKERTKNYSFSKNAGKYLCSPAGRAVVKIDMQWYLGQGRVEHLRKEELCKWQQLRDA